MKKENTNEESNADNWYPLLSAVNKVEYTDVKIVEAAIKQNDIVYTGRRHHNVIESMKGEYDGNIATQGFIDNRGNFLTRSEAAHIALNTGQIDKLKWPPLLYSEDLY